LWAALGGPRLVPRRLCVEQLDQLRDGPSRPVEDRREGCQGFIVNPEDAAIDQRVLGPRHGGHGDEVGERLPRDSRSIPDQGVLIGR
jgi:hypothetical protein